MIPAWAQPDMTTEYIRDVEGVIKLTGSAKNASEKELATKFVEDVYGVKSVNNQMTIE